MIFTLEVLQAFHGDCLLLHYGTDEEPKVIVIDGGPAGTYKQFLKPRLLEIKDAFFPADPLPLSMVMVSHLDDDHVNGILKLTDDVINTPNFAINNFWFNTFDDIIGNIQVPGISSIRASASATNVSDIFPTSLPVDEHIKAVVASTGQGRQLRNDAESLNASVNNPFTPIAGGKAALVRGDIGNNKIDWDTDLTITVIHPNQQRILELQKQWDKDLKKALAKGDHSIILSSFANMDTSPFNLSSIVCLVTFKNKSILLTGDARGDDILDALKSNNLLNADGKIHIDILKMPHHGSIRNLPPGFFQTIVADNYVISANGKFHNPDHETLEMLAEETIGRDDFTIHFTNEIGEFDLKSTLDNFIATESNKGRQFKSNFRDNNSKSIVLNLLDKITH